MTLITIENKYGMLVVHEGKKLPRASHEWHASGLDVYLKGSFKNNYDQAANLAMNYALSIHVPVISLKRVK